MTSLRAKYPEYFDLDTDKGLEVYVWQVAQDSYSCGVLPGTDGEKTQEELWNRKELWYLKPVTIEEMRAILSTYDLPEDRVAVIPFHMPYSSYAYRITDVYREMVRNLFFKDADEAADSQ